MSDEADAAEDVAPLKQEGSFASVKGGAPGPAFGNEASREQRLRELERRIGLLEKKLPPMELSEPHQTHLASVKEKLDSLRTPVHDAYDASCAKLAEWLKEEYASLDQLVLSGRAKRAFVLQQEERMRALAKDFEEINELTKYSDLSLVQNVPVLEPKLATVSSALHLDVIRATELLQTTQAITQAYRATIEEMSRQLVQYNSKLKR